MATLLEQLDSGMGIWLALAVCAVVLLGALRWVRCSAWRGARQVRRWLHQELDAQRYHCLHKLTVALSDGSTTQIDHVVVSPYGLFVLESRHLPGSIVGSPMQPTWTQTLYRQRSSFPNPLRQNACHIQALSEVLQVPHAQLHSVVVFTADCSFKNALPLCVTRGRACVDFIRSHTQEVWSEQEVAQHVQALKQPRLAPLRGNVSAQAVRLQVRHKVEPQKKVVAKLSAEGGGGRTAPALAPARPGPRARTASVFDAPSCPECGDSLVRRSLPHSDGSVRYFWRCEQFPQCQVVMAETTDAPT